MSLARSSFIHESKQKVVRFQHRNIVQKSVWLQIFLLLLLYKKFTIHMKDVQGKHTYTQKFGFNINFAKRKKTENLSAHLIQIPPLCIISINSQQS